jgi:hypothetical protein
MKTRRRKMVFAVNIWCLFEEDRENNHFVFARVMM